MLGNQRDLDALRPFIETYRTDGKSTELANSLVSAYCETDYVARADPDVVLGIGEHSPALSALMQQLGGATAAFLTAWNPLSQPTESAENETAAMSLEAALTRRSAPFVRGVGKARNGEWPAEPSILAVGVSKEDAILLGRQFRQNAIVFVGNDAVPRLVLLR